VERREFFRALALAVTAPAVTARVAIAQAQGGAQEPALPGEGNVGTLRDPTAVGRPRGPTDVYENDAEIQRIEKQLACSCGCTLDVFTCRTTDFTCTYSPALHREVLALWADGKRGQQILNAFVAKYGEKALMAPKPEGFNLAGYWVPGAAVALGSGALLAVLLRRRAAVAAARAAPGAPTTVATPEEWERLRQALDEVED